MRIILTITFFSLLALGCNQISGVNDLEFEDTATNTAADSNTNTDTSSSTNSDTDTASDTSLPNQVCTPSETRLCNGVLGNCAKGIETCREDGRDWGSCSIQPLESDNCQLGDDSNCNGTPNEQCTCESNDVQDCGVTDVGVCQFGVSTCVAGAWTPCLGDIAPVDRNCSSTLDNDCNGIVDNEDASCCTPGVCAGDKSCDASGNVVCTDSCGDIVLVNTCIPSAQNGTCTDAECGCASGWTGTNCDRCLIHVNASSTAGGNGKSWGTAYKSLHKALEAAENGGCEVWVTKGTYHPEADKDGDTTPDDPKTLIFVLRPDVALYGGFAGNEVSRDERDFSGNETILSGDINGDDNPDGSYANTYTDNTYHVLYSLNTERLDGFTVSRGKGDTAAGVNGTGGGLYNLADLYIENCIFRFNTAFEGGAIYNYSARPKIENCLFFDNQGNSVSANGGAIYNYDSTVFISNSIFKNNVAPMNGGAIYNDNSDGYVYNTVFSNNTATIFNIGSSPTFTNCTFAHNKGGLYPPMQFAIVNKASSSPTIQNSIFWENVDNSNTGILNDDATCQPTLAYSNIQFGDCSTITHSVCGAGNLNTDPLFMDGETSDFRLSSASPCINSGQNSAVEKDRTDLDGDGNAAEQVPFDVAGLPRINTTDGASIVDMGAFEY